ncbi:hypothetical protein SAMN05216388_100144 [Halorientalis persicus]|uniref:Big-1 domain-containing protein n=1 Tax=Halorientalis persicus TaxID=1367881 RepID=A0A1H8CS25_9EURY|nr:Ig-like domain-containing protein [Halorientalis persicus]SEM96947.1 hypothetical protein SAMN05216388_100144 [Halorientalis persicus]
MSFRDDERGQAIQVGAVLLFATLIIAFSTYQAFVVPNQNREVEFNHNQDVQGDLQEVRNTVVSVPGGNTGRSIRVDLGARYPSRLVALNPGPATGTLRTIGTSDERYKLTITNATTTGETGDYWNGSSHVYNTGGLAYAPNYNLYDQAPRTIYENSVLYNEGRDRSITVTDQQLIRGNRITLVTLNGSLGTTRSGTVSVDPEPLSTSTRTVTVSNDSHNVTVRVPTRLSAAQWRNLTAGETNVRGLTVDSGAVDGDWGLLKLDLEPDTTYDLRMAKVGMGTGYDDPTAEYILPVAGNESTVPEGGTQRITVEVRDGYNNPVEGVDVNASVSLTDASVSPTQRETNAEGQVVFAYNATDVEIDGVAQETERLNISFDTPPGGLDTTTFDRQAPENVTVELTVRNADDSGLGGGGGGSGDLVYDGNAVAYDGQDGNSVPGGVNATFINEFGQDLTITDIRVAPQNANIDTLDDTVGTNTPAAPGRNELYVDSDVQNGYVDVDDGFGLPTTIDVDSDGFLNNGNPVVSAGSPMTVYLYEFYDGGTNVDMGGQTVDITVSYRLENGLFGEKTYSVTPTGSGSGGGGTTAAERVDFVTGSQDPDFTLTGSLAFDIENTGMSDVTVEQMSVDVTSAENIQTLEEGIGVNPEMEIVGTTDSGSYSTGSYSLGNTVTLDNFATIDGNSQATFGLRYFRRGSNRQSVASEDISVTVTYSDGSTDTFTFTA